MNFKENNLYIMKIYNFYKKILKNGTFLGKYKILFY